jgi:hypothetical protein
MSKIVNQRELIQDDLICVLDGVDDRVITNACQVVVDRMKILEDSTSKLLHECNAMLELLNGPSGDRVPHFLIKRFSDAVMEFSK